MKTVGLIVNPIAGMGGSVGLKGTDGEMVKRARLLGARPVTPERAVDFLAHVTHGEDIVWLAAPGAMGAAYLAPLGFTVSVVDGHATAHATAHASAHDPNSETTADDTRRIAVAMVRAGVDLLVFVGGDGTARDICDAIGVERPVVAVPTGVKVYSSAFALSPRAAAVMVDAFVEGVGLTEVEVLDIDEDAFRDNRLQARHYGFLLAPDVGAQLQPGKEGTHATPDTAENQRDIAAAFIEEMETDVLYLLGPGTTVQAIAKDLTVEKTLLGIDALLNGQIIARDLNERQILTMLETHSQAKIVVTPLGGNGFILGRGNKPFTPEVIRRVGLDRIMVVATEQKAQQIGLLRVDTGDAALDAQLSGYREVMIGYGIARAMKVQAA
ncbi:MAG: ATP-NAD kinase family protein [Anaerolineae bacterium]|nr:ATP-NAD kinase family protein [Anaerolineae bacterium]